MFSPDNFEQPGGDRPVPRWVHVALWVPFLTTQAWLLTAELVRTHPSPSSQTVVGWLLIATIVTSILGFGSVLAVCLYNLIKAMLTGRKHVAPVLTSQAGLAQVINKEVSR